MQRALAVAIVSLLGCLSGCAARAPVGGTGAGERTPLPTREGLASYYGREFHGRVTASGVRFDMNAMVAAHPTYPFGTRLRVTNLANRRSATVRIVDRGPAPALQAAGLVIDVSRRAAEVLGFVQRGRTPVRLQVLAWGRP
jgi:rare lipoprotein A